MIMNCQCILVSGSGSDIMPRIPAFCSTYGIDSITITISVKENAHFFGYENLC